jgi:hypothetical protein
MCANTLNEIGLLTRFFSFISLIGVCGIFSIQSCTFSSDSEFFIEIDTSNVVIPELDFSETDTIYLRGNKNLRFTIPENVIVYGIELSLDGSVIRSLDGDMHNFGINTKEIEDGIYSLKLSVFS